MAGELSCGQETQLFFMSPLIAQLMLNLSAGPCDLGVNYGCQVWGSQERILEGGGSREQHV